ncbi:MAG: flagellar basal body rod protein FlgB [bacterium]|nr:flagellar basal body rod protein FlgB [bacterium]MCP5067354.1 flagellar basal body rod protein FlgB [bacterium]
MPGPEIGAMPLLEDAMRFRLARQAALAGNVANVDTPGYRRVDLEFESALADASARLDRTDPRHLGTGGSGSSADYRIVRGPRGTRPDGNGVELDSELIALNRNSGAFQDQAAVLSRLLVLRRIAVTGEAR